MPTDAVLYSFDVNDWPNHRREELLSSEAIEPRERALVLDYGAVLINSNAVRREYARGARRWVVVRAA